MTYMNIMPAFRVDPTIQPMNLLIEKSTSLSNFVLGIYYLMVLEARTGGCPECTHS